MFEPQPPRRRLWPVLLPLTLVVALAAIWTGLWFYAASAAERAIDGWRAREAKSGRTYQCAEEAIGGFPFRIEVRCSSPNAELRSGGTPLVIKGGDASVLAQVFQPTVLLAEFKSPMTVAESGQPPMFLVNWTLGQSSLRGTPRSPERVSLMFDNAVVEEPGRKLFNAKRVELHGRMVEGSAAQNPVIEMVLRTNAASAPELHALTVAPIDADITWIVRGLADFAPKPWPARFREIQARGGRIEITQARVQQGDVIAVTTGALTLNERGNLEGQLQLTAVNIDQVINALDIEGIVSRGRVGATIDKLDRLVPGLGNFARKNAAPGLIAGLEAIGKRTTLEGKPAMTVPLRFTDGRAMLGPIPVGRAPPLF